MSGLTDNYIYPSPERICLCIRLNNAGKYCHINLNIMVMLQNVGEICEILDFGRREASSAPYVHYLVEKVNEIGILINKPKREKPNKIQFVMELKPIDHPMRFYFAKWACNRLTEDADLAKIADEAHFDHVAFGAENTHTHTLKSRRTQSLCDADFVSEAKLDHFSSKMSN